MGWITVFATSLLFPVTLNGELTVIHERLQNGVQVIASVRPSAPYSVASLWLNCGSSADPEGREGTAHLVEHLLPLKQFNSATIQIAIERKGALLLPETGRDFMAFHIQSPDNVLPQVFPFLVEAVSDLRIDIDVLEREKQLIWLETLALYEDPFWLMKAALEAKLFEGTAHSHPPTGWLETVKQLNLSDVKEFHSKHFVAPKFSLVAIVQNEATLKVLKEAVSNLPLTPKVETFTASLSTRSPTPAFEVMLRDVLSHPKEAFWGIGWRVPISAEEKVAMDALVMHLRQIAIPILFGQIGVVQKWNMVVNPVKGSSVITVSTRLRPNSDLIERGLKQVLRELAQHGLTENELTRLKRFLLWEHFRTLNSPIRLNRKLGQWWVLYNEPIGAQQYGEVIAKLSSDQIRRIAAKLESVQPVKFVVTR